MLDTFIELATSATTIGTITEASMTRYEISIHGKTNDSKPFELMFRLVEGIEQDGRINP